MDHGAPRGSLLGPIAGLRSSKSELEPAVVTHYSMSFLELVISQIILSTTIPISLFQIHLA